MIDPNNDKLSIVRQCDLLGLNRSTYYRPEAGINESSVNLHLMKEIDRIYTSAPYMGYRRITAVLRREGHRVNYKRIRRLMKKMGLQGVAPGPNTSRPHPQNKIYPYLLRNVEIERIDQVWSTDITYIPMPRGFMYLVAVIDWHSRYVLSWRLSNTLDANFCIECLLDALATGRKPEIFNTDQGAQFTSTAFTQVLLDNEIRISMDGRGRALDNVFVERLWRSVKYEDIYLKEYESPFALNAGLREYFELYNTWRPHQSLNNQTPHEVYFGQTANMPEHTTIKPLRMEASPKLPLDA